MLWVVPPFLAITLSVVLRLSARVKSAAAAQQASGLVTLPADHPLLRPVERRPARGASARGWCSGRWPGSVAVLGLMRGAQAVTRARLLGIDNA